MSLSRTSSPQQTRQQKHRSQLSASSSAPPPNARMSPASRYHSNLKVLRRRDPSITSIFDQFSHVCVYHHNGKKWEKQGFEGSMFLYERESYPPYGFYILNRVGMEDYIQRLYPEDDITAHSGYVMLRSYPSYTAARLDAIQQKLSSTLPDKFSDIYAYTEAPTTNEKGESQTIGLWTFSTDGSESLQHKNIPYPEHFRYGPDRPPPANPFNRTTTSAPNEGDPEQSSNQTVHPTAHALGLSDVDKLFAKFLPQQVQNPQLTSSTTPAPTSALQSLFAGAGSSSTYPQAPLPGALPSSPPPPQSTGIGLLDTIFASAVAPGPNSQQQQQPVPSALSSLSYPLPPTLPQSTIPFRSHTPKSKASPSPQVLSPNVIGSLLGLPPSRTPSAASSLASYSGSSPGADAIDGPNAKHISHSPSHPSSRDGDNEDDSHAGSSSDGSGGGGGGLGAIAAHALGRSVPIQIRAPLNQQTQPTQHLFSDSAFKNSGLGVGQGGSTHGDATPRQTFLHNQHVQNLASATSSANANAKATPGGGGGGGGGKANGETKPRNGRPLVPFEPNSELWPYARQTQEITSGEEERGGGGGGEGESDIVELNWEDMSALSDPAAFLRAQKKQQKLRSSTGGTTKQNGTNIVPLSGGREDSTTPTTTQGKKKKEKKKNSWDFPTLEALNANFGGEISDGDIGAGDVRVKENGAGMMMNLNGKNVPVPVTFSENSPPASPSPSSPMDIPSSQGQSHTTATPTGNDEEVSVSGESNGVNGSAKKKKRNRRKLKKPVTAAGSGSGITTEVEQQQQQQLPLDTTQMGPVHSEKVLSALLTGLSEQPEQRRPTAHERNKFVREVLTLIQTDPEFANTLWKRYYTQSPAA
ncbi:hypothetical protein AGABI1DRAFT_131392 [Agaricus bisporus var. burnettii JB137-S8]|uniref:mRNA-decapping enzyme C-terminal domain-containing protein n=1 Tax=Agaricus bisporus var. burnettii (strain JB137-S8 / ATCC MYA-4627 / FGSC 10392) TaxID=597362 RepID=K5XNR0_AGABU|nr:uncharacterized protein AGABI1DRAFT_131392 [Agaricus bisporus var. burnettii JB137-S8]EKM76300.1 hypothetical protein AGABI1DRAFT_131392 [Agaricus bisporus var. burnettii JB137-S8]